MLEEIIPFPSDETTPPVTKMNFADFIVLVDEENLAVLGQRPKGVVGDFFQFVDALAEGSEDIGGFLCGYGLSVGVFLGLGYLLGPAGITWLMAILTAMRASMSTLVE